MAIINCMPCGGEDDTIYGVIDRTISEFRNSKVTAIGPYAFAQCSNLEVIDCPNCLSFSYFTAGTGYFDWNLNPCEWIYGSKSKSSATTTYHISGCSNLREITLGVSVIASSMFGRSVFSKIKRVVLPDCTSVGMHAFSSAQVQYFYAPKAVLGDHWFSGWTNGVSAMELVCANGVLSPSQNGYYIPSYVSKLTMFGTGWVESNVNTYSSMMSNYLVELNMPNCSAIYRQGLYNYNKLKKASFQNVTLMGSSAFAYCYSLSSLYAPNVTTISDYAFYQCYSLETVNIQNVETIGSSAFQGCNLLKSLYLLKLKSMYGSVFVNCTRLSEIYIGASSVPTLYSTTFNTTPIHSLNGSIYVRQSLVEQYKVANWWSAYSTIISGYDFPEE